MDNEAVGLRCCEAHGSEDEEDGEKKEEEYRAHGYTFTHLKSQILGKLSLQFFRAGQFLRYLLRAKGRHGIHSPFVYQLIEAVCDRRPYYGLVDVERMRLALRSDHRPVEVAGLGAGSTAFSSNRRTVSAIASTQQRHAQVYRLLYHLSHLQQADTLWELGTGLGLSSIVLASAHRGGTLHTVEGDPAIATVARDTFHRVPYTNIRLHEGLFGDVLPQLTASAPHPGFVLLDGDHSFEATVALLEQILPILADDGLLILDDIYWSPGMKRAWQWLQARKEVTVTVDTFYLGLAWKRFGQAKEGFVLSI